MRDVGEPVLDGEWDVRREAGLLPPFLSKRIAESRGWTLLLGIPVAPFRVEGTTLVYYGIPLRDELVPEPGGSWSGRARLAGRELWRFRLVPRAGGSRTQVRGYRRGDS